MGQYRYFLFIISSLLSCANPVVPTGGPKDNSAPRYSSVEITKEKGLTRLQFFFKEQVTLNQPNKNIIISPASKTIIETKTGQNSVTISLKDADTSHKPQYLQLLTGWVQDLNEKNPADSTPFIILNTSYKILDSTTITKNIKCLIDSKENDLKIYLFDTFPVNKSLDGLYYSVITKAGNFQIPSFTSSPRTKYILLNDQNSNNQIDTSEYYNIYPNSISDTSKPVIYYCPSIRNPKPEFQILNNTISITGLRGAVINHPGFYFYHPDTSYIHLQDSIIPKVLYDDEQTAYYPKYNKKIPEQRARAQQYTAADSTLTIITSNSINKVLKNFAVIKLNDSNIIRLPFSIDLPNKIYISSIPNNNIKVIIEDSSILYDEDTFNKEINIDAEPRKLNFGTLIVSKELSDSSQYIIYIKHDENYTKYILSRSSPSILIKHTTGSYNLIIIKDRDLNQTYTKASSTQLSGEEPVAVLKNIVISDKLENSITIDHAQLFTNH